MAEITQKCSGNVLGFFPDYRIFVCVSKYMQMLKLSQFFSANQRPESDDTVLFCL